MAPHNLLLKSPTGRLLLAPPSEANDEENARIRCHPTTRKYLRYLAENITKEDARELREERLKDPSLLEFHLYKIDKDGGTQFVGGTMIFHINEEHNSCEVGIIVGPEAHGGGIATDAFLTMLTYVFEERKFHRATFETGADNLAMRGWLEKVAGARLEAQRIGAWKDPLVGYSDVTGYAILDTEWRERVKGNLEKRLGL
ncbi:hypothetical protein V5O48_003261 [Marasmius crinis-equi]|uniref:N-acetyltransferase domain-containing protein n=1 Tax=Marasmius crinis-equi TaxID=585013 RepID=A0ABR3FTH0_9AGAR